jgi:hypothetical protein
VKITAPRGILWAVRFTEDPLSRALLRVFRQSQNGCSRKPIAHKHARCRKHHLLVATLLRFQNGFVSMFLFFCGFSIRDSSCRTRAIYFLPCLSPVNEHSATLLKLGVAFWLVVRILGMFAEGNYCREGRHTSKFFSGVVPCATRFRSARRRGPFTLRPLDIDAPVTRESVTNCCDLIPGDYRSISSTHPSEELVLAGPTVWLPRCFSAPLGSDPRQTSD